MRVFSSVASLTVHVAITAAVLFGSAKTGRSTPTRPERMTVVFPTPERPGRSDIEIPAGPTMISTDIGAIRLPDFRFQAGAPAPVHFPASPGSSTVVLGPSSASGWVMLGSQDGPEMLTGPLPRYPEPLRQVAIEGRVLLEAIVDTTGKVVGDSVLVISATNPEFVAAARQALLVTLFRPAFVAGRAARVRVRIPYEFTIRNGTGRAR